jgi:Flp pilus assembly protein TadD
MDIRQWLDRLGLGQYAEAFVALGIQPHEAAQLTEADLKELGVASLVHGHRILQAAAAPPEPPVPPDSPDTLTDRVLQRFPFPIAYGYRQVVAPESATHAVDCVFYTYTALLRFTALAFLGQFLSGPGQNPHAAKVLRQLQSPTLESWLTVITTLGKHLFPPLPGPGLAYPSFAEGGPFSPGLAAAARQLPKLRRDGVQVHERLRLLRNTRAHGAPWDEAECARRLPGLQALLEAVLECFAPLGEIALLRRSPGGLIRLVGAAEPFVEEPIPELRIEDGFEASETLLLGPDGALLPLYPLFLAPDAPLPEGYVEPLLSFDGYGKQVVMYLGVRSWTARQDTLARYLDLLRAKDIDPRFTKVDLSPWGVADWARETSRGVIENLTGVKYFPEVYQERRAVRTARSPARREDEEAEPDDAGQGVDDAVADWLARGREAALIVAAEAGSGKTSLFCRLAENLLADEPTPAAGTAPSAGAALPERPDTDADCVLLLLGGGLRGRTTLFERLRDGLGFSDDPARGGLARFDELLAAWQAVGEREDLDYGERRLLILMDALNEAEDPKRLFEELSALAADAAAANTRAGRPWVRLLVSVRAERLETLLARWGAASDTPFLQHPQNFAHFPDARGHPMPWLGLRRFTPAEVEAAYAIAQQGPGRRCPAPWARLAPTTRALLRHPLMLALFHTACAGMEQPPTLTSADALWDAWLARTFDPAQGGAQLQALALDLADDGLDGGHDAIPAALAETWRGRWQAALGHDPVRIAAGLDPLERLVEAGLLRRTEAGGLDWVSDSLAEQVLFLALQRRDPALEEASFRAWLALPVSRRLDGALGRVGAAIWRSGRPLAVRPVLDVAYRRSRALLADLLLDVIPRGLPAEVAQPVAAFATDLLRLVDGCIGDGNRRRMDRLKDGLLWELDQRLADRWGYLSVRREIARCILTLAEQLCALEPDNTEYLRDLSISFHKLADLDGRTDPAAARAGYAQALAIVRRLVELEPDNTEYLRDLSVSYGRLADLDGRTDPAAARAGYAQGLAIPRRLVELEPDNTTYLRDLSISYDRLADLDRRTDPAAARAGYAQGLAIVRRLVELEPDNTTYLRDLGISCRQMGDTERTRAPEEALRWYAEAADWGERLVALQPDDTQFLSDLRYYCDRAASLREASHPDDAKPWLAQGVELGRRLSVLDSSNDQRLNLSRWLVRLGSAESKLGLPEAEAYYREALAIREAIVEADPKNHEAWGLLSSALGRLAEWCLGQGKTEEERAWSERADQAMERAAALQPEDADVQYGLACSRARLGRTQEALAALSRSVDLGNTDANWVAEDPDLRSLRGLPEFEAILARMRGNAG